MESEPRDRGLPLFFNLPHLLYDAVWQRPGWIELRPARVVDGSGQPDGIVAELKAPRPVEWNTVLPFFGRFETISRKNPAGRANRDQNGLPFLGGRGACSKLSNPLRTRCARKKAGSAN